ncbi:hypothetical protein [Janibacter melonis]|uniref:hypothetical protein n=1 Tax=Janibacter melonis TaxID=262209 RepID=UPI00174A5D45|nr:hypothetical protein [Janibacter melonis]
MVVLGTGTWPDWLSAIATSIAVLVAARTYRRSRRDDHVRQARKVYVLHSVERCPAGAWVGVDEGWSERDVLLPQPGEDRGYQLKTKAVLVRATVHNASDEVISDVEVVVTADAVDGWPQAPQDPRYVIAAIPPGDDYVVHFVAKDLWSHDYGVQGIDLSLRLRFTDSAGNHWSREDARPVHALKHHNVRAMDPGLHTTVRTITRSSQMMSEPERPAQ